MTPGLPAGTVTFLFTDVERSTELARQFGAEYTALIGSHFELIDRAVERHRGSTIKTIGDGAFCVFPGAPDALRAARDLQGMVADFDWPLGGQIKVRVGMHTGEAEVVAGDYLGLDVHRAARLMAAGHGGQVLVSETTRLLAGAGFEFRDLGHHLLKGLENEEVIFQLVIPELPGEFPPLTTASVGTSNLPIRSSTMIGREDEIASVSNLVRKDRLVTVLGPGGVGKTSLAITVAGEVIRSFPGGATFVDLSSVADSEFVVPSIAAGVGAENRDFAGLCEHLRGSHALVVLDNFEQVVESAGEIARVLSGTDETHFLVTSQVPLRLSAERRFVLGPLNVGSGDESPGARLFLERARMIDPGFVADPTDVAELVERLEGLPLAIELVAARANLMSAGDMLERLTSGALAQSSLADLPERHRSLEATLEWSYGLLEDEVEPLFCALGLFAGSFTLAAAEAMAGDGVDALAGVSELVDRSLLTRSVSSAGRFRMLDSIRRFARDHLAESGQATAAQNRFIAYYLGLTVEAYSGFQSDRGEWWLSQFDEELDNLRELLTLLLGRDATEPGLSVLGNTWRFYVSRGHIEELLTWLDRFFRSAAPLSDTEASAKGLMAQAAAFYWQNDPEKAVSGYAEAVERARKLDEESLLADALYGLATSLIIADRAEEAWEPMLQSKGIYHRLGDRSGLADVVAGEAFATLRESGLAGLGSAFEEARDLYESVGRTINAAQATFAVAAVALAEGRVEDARNQAIRGIERGLELSDVFLQAWGVSYMARVEYDSGSIESAATLAGAAEAAREKVGSGWGPGIVGLEEASDLLIQRLGESEAKSLMAPGFELSLEDAVQLALGFGDTP